MIQVFLDKINKTNDIKKLNCDDKIVLASEIREYLLDVISKNGGHLASNLGVVELTIALESVFDLTKDKLIWDVGHQCYVHKILNGRKDKLKSIRQMNGISGFPKVMESETDCFNTGHSSTSISAALGMAMARDIKNDNYNVIAFIGDGALTGGMALEALNHVGCTQTKMIIVLNDNEMSISRNISGMNKLLTNLRSRKKYRSTNSKWRKILSKVPIFGDKIVKVVGSSKNAIKQVFIPGMYFEEIGIKYLGPVDGHNIKELENIFEKAKSFDEPVIIHVLTKKGKGYKPAEDIPSKFHGVGPFDLTTGDTGKSSYNYSKVFGDKLVNLAKSNKKICAVTAAMRDGVGLTKFALKYPKRYFDVGIAEEHALTFSAGLARSGLIPFVSIYSSFYQRAYDQIIHDICLQNLHVVMCVDRAGIVGNDGETHQGLYDMAFFRLIPNITIMAPKNFHELELMMDFAVSYNGPIVIRYPRGGESRANMKVKNIYYGKSEFISEGNNLTIIAIGNMVSRAVEVAELLKNDNISCDIINVRFLKPLDSKKILSSIIKTKNLITIEDGTCIDGLSTAIQELLVKNKIIDINYRFFAYPDKFIKHGSVSQIEKKYGLDADSIYKDVKRFFNIV